MIVGERLSGTTMANGTKRTHFNPAFWLAAWSPEFGRRPSRDCHVYALYVRTGTVARITVENAHFEKGLGRAIFPVTDVKQIIDLDGLSALEREEMLAEIDAAGDLTLDIESVFTSIEQSSPFEHLQAAVADQRIDTWDRKANIAAFVAIQHLRNPRQWNVLLRWREERMGKPRWESLARLMNPNTWRELIGGLANQLSESRWVIHASREDTFPIGDTTVLVDSQGNRAWTPLSPKLLVEICLDQPAAIPAVNVTSNVNAVEVKKLNYIRLLAAQSSSMILFSDATLLRDIAESYELRVLRRQ